MRGPILNMSPGLGASGVDIEYRRNSQGMTARSLILKTTSCFGFGLCIFLLFLFVSTRDTSKQGLSHGILRDGI